MARPEINRSGEIEVFVRVVEAGSFSAAARALRMTPSAVSKLIARLETRLGARLISRSTRRLQLTPEGAAFHDSGMRILADLDAAEREAAAGAAPRGRLRVNSYVPFGQHRLMPLLPRFLERYPEISVEAVLTDSVIDLMEERADVAIRAGPLRESRLVARKLGQSRMVVVASPAYLEERGTPRTPADLTSHNLLAFGFVRHIDGMPFVDATGAPVMVPIAGNATVSDGEAMRLTTLAGAGVARLARWHVEPDIAAGRLVQLLEDFNPGDEEPTHAVYVGQGKHLPARVRAFLDFLAEAVRL
ncbi:DNA-binding transcriptional regulator, LysR family [Mesorhizobium sp. NFR06]|uniref:LysR family transcriptional regulator n=1 Tax=Mesorhizobium sp. NFR06 TaxID=1566290 RepID=UPI0008EF0E1A|nr:LysR family transcriptional regulator [Mesorhizobium sp. NFR06]SFO44167.1 DNA-binding transcriptional regulator, LysR family [Mesorhizobium sp. NFR06]